MAENSGAIFLSYTSQDGDAVRRICAALRAAGLEVWFDQNELRGGDAWDASIRRQIRDCALFLPVISAHTEARGEGYFRLEWRLAVERFHLMADDHAFLMPVVIDDTNEASARVPDRFRERQWTRLPGGETPQAFIDQVKRTLAALSAGTPVQSAPRAKQASGTPTAPTRPRRVRMIAALATAIVAVASVAGLVMWNRQKVSPTPAGRPAAATVAAAPALDPKSIAVLPFVNLTGRADDVYLADGLQEEILSTLARMHDLKVISRTSVSEFRGFTPNVREIGNRLGVGSVLEGSVRREGQKIRLTVQLIDTRNDRHILAADYDRELGHLFGLQSEVAGKVAEALAATLTGYERGELDRVATNNGDAYNLYLRAVAMGFRSTVVDDHTDLDGAQRLLKQALQLDPNFSDAAALVSVLCSAFFYFEKNPADGDCGRKYYERALTLDPQLPEARLARGYYEVYVTGELDLAIADLDAVVRLRPNSAMAHSVLGRALRRNRRFSEALAHFERAWDLDPLRPGPPHWIATTLMGLRRYPELIAHWRLYQRRFPTVTYAYIDIARIECLIQHSPEPLRRALLDHGGALSAEDRNKAETILARVEGRYLDAAKGLLSWKLDPLDRDLRLGLLYWAAGKTAESERMFRAAKQEAQSQLRREHDPAEVSEYLALAQSMLGEHAAALATIDALRAEYPEARDPVNGPSLSFTRSIILVRAGRKEEGYAEVQRLLRVPFSAPVDLLDDGAGEMLLLVKDDPHYDEIVNRPPRL